MIEQVLKIDIKTVFQDYIRLLESAQVAVNGKIIYFNQEQPALGFDSVQEEVSVLDQDNQSELV